MGLADLITTLQSAPELAAGWQDVVTTPDPGAGVNLDLHRVPGEWWLKVITIKYGLITSATVANRLCRFEIWDAAGNLIVQTPLSGGVPASSLFTAFGAVGIDSDLQTATSGHGPIPEILIPPGWQVGAGVDGLQGGDQITGLMMICHKIPTSAFRAGAGG